MADETKTSIVLPIDIEAEMRKSYLDYSMSVIIARALPDVRDGLKPVQRRILVAMNDLGLASNRGYRKRAKICGDTSGNYHPHGEAVIYPARSEEHTSELQSQSNLVCRLLLDKKNLGTTDNGIIAVRRRLTRAIKALAEQDKSPPGALDRVLFTVRSGGAVLPEDADWVEGVRNVVYLPSADPHRSAVAPLASARRLVFFKPFSHTIYHPFPPPRDISQ